MKPGAHPGGIFSLLLKSLSRVVFRPPPLRIWSGALQHSASGKCVSVPSPAVAGSDARLLACDATKPGPGQQWEHDNGLLKTVGACQRFPCRLLSIDACSGFRANWFAGNRCSRVSLPAEPGDERDLAVGRPAQPSDCRAVRFGGQS